MARYKVLRGVAHNVGHSFTSLMNFAGDDYVMGHILWFARRSNRDTLNINLVTGEAGPRELLADPISDIPAVYSKFFWDQVVVRDLTGHMFAPLSLGFDMTLVLSDSHDIPRSFLKALTRAMLM